MSDLFIILKTELLALCLALFTFTRTDPDLDLRTDSLAWPWACLIATNLPDDLGSWLKLAVISRPALVTFLGCWGWALAGKASALLTVLLRSAPGFPPRREQPDRAAPDPGQHHVGTVL